jgi:hypothetical protein
VKQCPNSCSAQGKCLLYGLMGQLLSSSSSSSYSSGCKVSGSSCFVRCECDDGYYGNDCSLTKEIYSQLVSYREDVCFSLASTLPSQDVTKEIVKLRANTIINAVSDVVQVNSAALGNCSFVLIYTVKKFPSVSCEESVYSTIINAFSSVLALRTALSPTLFSQLENALNFLSEGCPPNVAIAEPSISLVTENLRVTTTATTAGSLIGMSLTSARTSYEEYSSVLLDSATFLDLPISSSLASDNLVITVRQYTNNPTGNTINSSGLAVTSVNYNDKSTSLSGSRTTIVGRRRATVELEAEREEDKIVIVLQNHEK